MAMSFSRPDPSSPASVADASFPTRRRGFDQGEVGEFLRMVAAELGRLQERERFLERELRDAQSSPDFSSAVLDDDELSRLLGEETARVISTARESATEIKAKAEEAAARMVSEAADEATRLREEADLEASRRRADATSDAEAEIGMAKQQGREMVNEARAYRERVLSELARRRELAREQIEQLIHGRDRLMQSFERARVVAVDVVAELRPLGEPDEYVNLTPTTGPVPVMVPNDMRPADDRLASTGQPTGDDSDSDSSASAGRTAAFQAFDRAAEADDLPATPEDDTDAVDTEPVFADAAAVDVVDAEVAADVDAEVDAEVDADEMTVDRATMDDIWSDDAEPASDSGEESPESTDAGEQAASSGVSEAGTGDDLEHSEDPADDVVVDLFARIRADASPAGNEEIADPTDDPGADGEISATETPDKADAGDPEQQDSEQQDPEQQDSGQEPEVTDDQANPFEVRDEDLTPLIVASAKKLKRVLADEQNEVLDQLRRAEVVESIDDLLPSAGEHGGRYTAAITDDLKAAAQAGATSAVGSKKKLRAATSKLALSQAGAVLEEFLVMPLRDRLDRAVSDGAGDSEAVTKATRAIYREWKTRYIDEQLDDVLRAAHGRGRLAGFAAGTKLIWTVDPSGPACPDCDDNVLGGAVDAGSEFPTGDTYAPAHPGCRCLLSPVEG